jgi:protein MpaA
MAPSRTKLEDKKIQGIKMKPAIMDSSQDQDQDQDQVSESPGIIRDSDKVDLKIKFCKKVEANFKKNRWGPANCLENSWNFVRSSVQGDPLLWKTYGKFPGPGKEAETETTLIMCGVHGDEITPIKFCFDAIAHLENVKLGKVIDPHTQKPVSLDGKFVIVAPIVNPDSYFKKRPTRTNANGVDVNRNFPTKDFRKKAHHSWVSRYRKDKRRNPGKVAMSEPETIFQVNLIYRYRPDKIISVHAPLTMLDYDGPASEHTGGIVGSRANQLLIRMSEQAKGYRIKNYPFFPGSLGNYAGNERNIPTFTLELPTSDARKASSYWSLFKGSIHSAIMHDIKGEGFVALENEEAKTKKVKSN